MPKGLRPHGGEIVMVPIDEITLLANPKIHSEEQITDMMDSIKKFGFVDPCLIGPANTLLAGYCRLEAMKRLGHTEIPCRIVRLKEDEFFAYIMSEGRIAEKTSWDYEVFIKKYLEMPEVERANIVAWREEEIQDLIRWQEEQAQPVEIEEPTELPPPPELDTSRVQVNLSFPRRYWDLHHEEIENELMDFCRRHEGAEFQARLEFGRRRR